MLRFLITEWPFSSPYSLSLRPMVGRIAWSYFLLDVRVGVGCGGSSIFRPIGSICDADAAPMRPWRPQLTPLSWLIQPVLCLSHLQIHDFTEISAPMSSQVRSKALLNYKMCAARLANEYLRGRSPRERFPCSSSSQSLYIIPFRSHCSHFFHLSNQIPISTFYHIYRSRNHANFQSLVAP